MKYAVALMLALMVPAASGENSTLFQAIRNGDVPTVKRHLTKAEVNATDPRGVTPLMHAAAFGNIETLRVLLDAGAEVNGRNRMDATALLWAAGDAEKARLLIERGADVAIQSKQGRTPLMAAASWPGNSRVVALILSKGTDARSQDRLGNTALSLAAKAGDLHSVKLLLAAGAEPNASDILGRTSLLAAAASGNPEIVRLLLQHGASVDAATHLPAAGTRQPTTNIIRNGPPSNSGVTALHNAAAIRTGGVGTLPA